MDPCFPLPTTKLPKLHVDRPTLVAWRRQAFDEVTQLLLDRESWYYKGQEPKYAYKLIYNKRGLEGYICTTEAARRKEFYAHGVLKMYLEDVSFGLYADNTLDQRGVSAYLDEDVFLDAAVLCVDEHQTLEDPFYFSGVKWTAHHSPSGVDVHADNVFFECSFATRDADNRMVLVQYINSPDLTPKQVQESHETARLARGRNHQITTFRADEEGTYCQSSGTLVANEAIPSWVGMKTVLQAFSSLSNLVGLADARAVARLSAAKASSASKVCYLCKKKFSMLRPRQNCRSCGHSICKHCTVKLKFFNVEGLVGATRGPLLAEDKFCLPCVRRARDERPESEDTIAKFVDSIVSEESVGDVALGIPIDHHDLSDDDGDDSDEEMRSARSASTTMRLAARYHKSTSSTSTSLSSRDGTVPYYQSYYNRSGSGEHVHDAVLYEPDMSKSNPAQAFAARATAPLPYHAPPPSYAQYEMHADPTRSSSESDLGRHQRLYPDVDMNIDLTASGRRLVRPRSARGGFPEPDPNAFNKLTESIAAQEALLQNIEFERQKLQYRRGGGAAPHVPQYVQDVSPQHLASSRSSDRFEVISEAY